MPIATGAQVLAADINNLVKIVRKTADETVNNSAAVQNDDELFFAMTANQVWTGELRLLGTSSATDADFRFVFTGPVGAVLQGQCIASEPAAGVLTYTHIEIITRQWQVQGAGANIVYIVVKFTVTNGANAGNLQLQWAQVTAKAADTKILTNSCIIAHLINP